MRERALLRHRQGKSFKMLVLIMHSAFLLFIAKPGAAQEMGTVPYAAITVPPAIPIDPFAALSGSGSTMSGVVYFSGGKFGKAFEGVSIQKRDFYGELFDDLVGLPESPLSLEPSESDADLWVGKLADRDGDFVAGISRFDRSQIGSGSVSILFDEPICQFGFKSRVNSPLRPISGNYLRGPIGIVFYSTDGVPLGNFLLGSEGETQFGFSLPTGSIPIVKGLSIENIDANGIQLTEMKYLAECMPFVS